MWFFLSCLVILDFLKVKKVNNKKKLKKFTKKVNEKDLKAIRFFLSLLSVFFCVSFIHSIGISVMSHWFIHNHNLRKNTEFWLLSIGIGNHNTFHMDFLCLKTKKIWLLSCRSWSCVGAVLMLIHCCCWFHQFFLKWFMIPFGHNDH